VFSLLDLYRLAADAVLFLHFLWIAWVGLGWLGTRGRPLVRGLHIGSLFYGILIELFRWPCPLTLAEVWLERRAGGEAYGDPFLVHYLKALIYPDLDEIAVTAAAMAACVGILGLYTWRFAHRSAGGW